jgi:hypothetical protein
MPPLPRLHGKEKMILPSIPIFGFPYSHWLYERKREERENE